MKYKIIFISAFLLISLSFSVAHAKTFHKIDCSSIPNFGNNAPYTFLQKENNGKFEILDKNGNSVKPYRFDESDEKKKGENLLDIYINYMSALFGGRKPNIDGFLKQLPFLQNYIAESGGYKLKCFENGDPVNTEGNVVKGTQFQDTRGCAYASIKQNGWLGEYTTDVAVIVSPGVEDTLECYIDDDAKKGCPRPVDYMCRVVSSKSTHDPVFITNYGSLDREYTQIKVNGEKKTACATGYVCNKYGRCVTKTDSGNECPSNCDRIDSGTVSLVQ